MIDDLNELFAAETVPSVPPALELEETVLLLVNVEKQVGVFAPYQDL